MSRSNEGGIDDPSALRGFQTAFEQNPFYLSFVFDAIALPQRATLARFTYCEEAVLQALELLTRSTAEIVWVKGTELREKICSLPGQSADEMGNAQWIGPMLKRLQLIDPAQRKRQVGGKLYATNGARWWTRCSATM